MITKSDVIATYLPCQFGGTADQGNVITQLGNLQFETMATTGHHHPAQWADHDWASLFLARWALVGADCQLTKSPAMQETHPLLPHLSQSAFYGSDKDQRTTLALVVY